MKTAHREASHAKRRWQADPMSMFKTVSRVKQPEAKEPEPEPEPEASAPDFEKPKLETTTKLDAKLTHWDLVDRFIHGTADKEVLWDWIETGFTYSQIMYLLAKDGTEFTDEATAAIAEQLDIYEAVIARFQRTGRVGFDGPQLNIARAAAHVMDELIDYTSKEVAEKAALWSIEQMARIRKIWTNTSRYKGLH